MLVLYNVLSVLLFSCSYSPYISFSMAKLTLPFVLAAVSSMAVAIAIPENSALQKRSTDQSKAVIVQMFEWTWDRQVYSFQLSGHIFDDLRSVAAECTSFIGSAGYGAVQGK